MGESKHTPGPWVVNGPPENQIVWSDAENRICFLAHSAGRDEDRDYANGRLIAAAPELLDALIAAREWLEGWASAEPQIAVIDAALAKAGASHV